MSKKKSLINSALIYTIGTFLLKGINFFTVPIFTNLLSTADYGIVNIYSTWNGIFAILIGMGINGTLGTAKANLEDNEYREYLSSVMFLSTLTFIGVLILAFIFRGGLEKLLELNERLIFVLILQSFFTFVINFISAKYTFDKKPKKYLCISFLVTILNVSMSIIFIKSMTENRYEGRIYGGALATILIGVVAYYLILKEGKKLISRKYWGYCLPIAVPIIFHNLSHLVLNQADRVMLQKATTESIVGIYSFTYNIGTILNIVNLAINNAWVAWYYDALNAEEYEEIKSRSKMYIIIFTILTCMFVLGSAEFVKILAPKEYWPGIKVLPMVILGYYFVFLYTFAVNYEFYKRKTNYIAVGTMLAAVVNIVVNILLIPKIGVYAAALSTLIAYSILFIMHEIIVRVVLKHRDFPFYYYLYSMFAVAITTTLFYFISDSIIVRWGIIVLTILVAAKYILNLLKKINMKKGEYDE